jgi:hypothetical protein
LVLRPKLDFGAKVVQSENLAIPTFWRMAMASISRRGAYWRSQVRLNGESNSRTFNTKTEAEKWGRHTESEMDRGIYYDRTEAENTTLLQALDRYEREIVARKLFPGQELQRVRHWRTQPLTCSP